MSKIAGGLYAITDTGLDPATMLSKSREILAAGAALIQYRNKHGHTGQRIKEARRLLKLCRKFNVPLIINDDITLAAEIGADGVHLGKNDPPVAVARTHLGDKAIIGCSCYNSLKQADVAAAGGADYLAFGSFFASPTKPDALPADPGIIRQAKQSMGLLVAAIGGITPVNGMTLINAGADMLAVISGLYGSDNPFDAARKYISLFKQYRETL